MALRNISVLAISGLISKRGAISALEKKSFCLIILGKIRLEITLSRDQGIIETLYDLKKKNC